MKKFFALIAVFYLVASCTEEVKFNNPGFQAYREGVLWKAVDVRATKSSGGVITLTASILDEDLTLTTANSIVGSYVLGTSSVNSKATFVTKYGGEIKTYETTPIKGPVAKISGLSPSGTGYLSTNSAATTGGLGTGLTVKVTANNDGVITEIRLASPGNNYKSGDLITITGGNNNAKFRVLNVEGSNGEIKITNISNGTISGEFKFNASYFDLGIVDGQEIINFQNGSFFNIPIQ
jgi:hypothetical protein